ncbi:MAG: hypothetical protein JOY54_20495 [Acidobacteriaceae bacterium]|nr:hypothetical protein [Acidobacteriaceae bacterium]
MREHIKILGVLNIAMGAMVALLGLVIFVVTSTIGGVIAASISGGDDPHAAAMVAPIVAAAGFAIGVFFLVLSLPSIIGGWGLLNYKSWSWLLMIIVSALHLFHVPLGTALGVYGLWVLLNDDTRRLLQNRGVGYAAPSHLSAGASGAGYPPPQPPRPV